LFEKGVQGPKDLDWAQDVGVVTSIPDCVNASQTLQLIESEQFGKVSRNAHA